MSRRKPNQFSIKHVAGGKLKVWGDHESLQFKGSRNGTTLMRLCDGASVGQTPNHSFAPNTRSDVGRAAGW